MRFRHGAHAHADLVVQRHDGRVAHRRPVQPYQLAGRIAGAQRSQVVVVQRHAKRRTEGGRGRIDVAAETHREAHLASEIDRVEQVVITIGRVVADHVAAGQRAADAARRLGRGRIAEAGEVGQQRLGVRRAGIARVELQVDPAGVAVGCQQRAGVDFHLEHRGGGRQAGAGAQGQGQDGPTPAQVQAGMQGKCFEHGHSLKGAAINGGGVRDGCRAGPGKAQRHGDAGARRQARDRRRDIGRAALGSAGVEQRHAGWQAWQGNLQRTGQRGRAVIGQRQRAVPLAGGARQHQAGAGGAHAGRDIGRRALQIQAQHDRIVVRCAVRRVGVLVLRFAVGVVVDDGGLVGIVMPFGRVRHLGAQRGAGQRVVQVTGFAVEHVRVRHGAGAAYKPFELVHKALADDGLDRIFVAVGVEVADQQHFRVAGGSHHLRHEGTDQALRLLDAGGGPAALAVALVAIFARRGRAAALGLEVVDDHRELAAIRRNKGLRHRRPVVDAVAIGERGAGQAHGCRLVDHGHADGVGAGGDRLGHDRVGPGAGGNRFIERVHQLLHRVVAAVLDFHQAHHVGIHGLQFADNLGALPLEFVEVVGTPAIAARRRAAADGAALAGAALVVGAVGERGEVIQDVGAGHFDVAAGQGRRRCARMVLRESRRDRRLQFEAGPAAALGAEVDHAGQARDGVARAQRSVQSQVRDHGRRHKDAVVEDDLVARVGGSQRRGLGRARAVAVGRHFQPARRQRHFAAAAQVFELRHGQRVIEAHQHAFHLRQVGIRQFDIGRRDGDAAGQAHDLANGRELGVSVAAGRGRVIGDGAGDADAVAHLHGAGVGGVHKQAVRRLRIAVAGLVLDEEAGTHLGGDHAFRGLHRAGHRAGGAAALDLRNRARGAGGRRHRDVDRAQRFLRLVVAETDRDRVAAGRQVGSDSQVGSGAGAGACCRLKVNQCDAGAGAGRDRCRVDHTVQIAGAEGGRAAGAQRQRQVGRAHGHDRRLRGNAALVDGAGRVAGSRCAGGKVGGVVVGVGATAAGAQGGGGVGQAGAAGALEATGVIAEQVDQLGAGRIGARQRRGAGDQRHLAGRAAHGQRAGGIWRGQVHGAVGAGRLLEQVILARLELGRAGRDLGHGPAAAGSAGVLHAPAVDVDCRTAAIEYFDEIVFIGGAAVAATAIDLADDDGRIGLGLRGQAGQQGGGNRGAATGGGGNDGRRSVRINPRSACIGRGQRIADEHALRRPRHAFPVRFDGRIAAQVALEQDRSMRKFLPVVAWFRHGAVAGRGARLEPVQAAHLGVAEQVAAGGGQVVGQRAGQKAQRVELGHAGQAGLVNHDVLHPFQHVGVEVLDGELACGNAAGRRKEPGPAAARAVGRVQVIGGGLRQPELAGGAARNQVLGQGNRPGGQQHADQDVRFGSGYGRRGVEICGRLAGAARFFALGSIEAERERGRDGIALDGVRRGPHHQHGADVGTELAEYLLAQRRELLRAEPTLRIGDAHMDDVFLGNLVRFAVQRGNLHAIGFVVVDDDGQLLGRDGGGARQRHGGQRQRQRQDHVRGQAGGDEFEKAHGRFQKWTGAGDYRLPGPPGAGKKKPGRRPGLIWRAAPCRRQLSLGCFFSGLATGYQANQGQATQHHAVGFWFWYWQYRDFATVRTTGGAHDCAGNAQVVGTSRQAVSRQRPRIHWMCANGCGVVGAVVHGQVVAGGVNFDQVETGNVDVLGAALVLREGRGDRRRGVEALLQVERVVVGERWGRCAEAVTDYAAEAAFCIVIHREHWIASVSALSGHCGGCQHCCDDDCFDFRFHEDSNRNI
uniref:Uncharacterized protein n=1 Tax=Tanacetum cinerariifolium TaxID=118510 RepID=A0A699GDC2_TANCI|nr:hypothetical protein [Tanacetum cinerariifolium]